MKLDSGKRRSRQSRASRPFQRGIEQLELRTLLAMDLSWVHQSGTTTTDVYESTTVAGDGAVYLGGWTGGTLPGQTNQGAVDAVLRKHSSNGALLWTSQFGTSSGDDVIWDVAAAPDLGVYVVGSTVGALGAQSMGGTDAFLRRYSSTGAVLWTHQWGTSGFDKGMAIALQLDGTIVTAGQTDGTFPGQPATGSFDSFITKWSPTGDMLSTIQINTNTNELLEALTVDNANNVYITGERIDASATDLFATAIGPSGNIVWDRTFGSSASDQTFGIDLTLDGGVVVAGSTFGSIDGSSTNQGNGDAFVAKLAADGGLTWVQMFGTPLSDIVQSLRVGPDGVIYAGGNSGTSTGTILFVRKFSTNGAILDTTEIASSGSSNMRGLDVGLDGSVVICGTTFGSLPGTTAVGIPDFFAVRFTQPSFVVTTLIDSVSPTDGVTSLREAILAANSNGSSSVDTISFLVAGKITYSSAMPAISTPSIIDGTTAPGYAGTPVVELDSGNLVSGQVGLFLSGGTSTLRGLALNRSGGVGVWLASSGNTIERNYIGTDLTGTIDRGNAFQGLFVQSNNNTIQDNLISGNDANGIWINGAGNNGVSNIVRRNRIGLRAAGDLALGNGGSGIFVSDGAKNNLIADNNIASNGNTGMWLLGVTNNRIQGNRIGTSANGSAGLGNATTGVRVSDGASGNWIGTDGDGVGDATEGNLISANGQAGVDIYGSGTTNNAVAGNTIGMNLAGSAKLANGWEGVRIFTDAQDNRIGSNKDGVSDNLERNIVSGNTFAGIAIVNANQNIIRGNYVGTTPSGLTSLGNTREGIYILADRITIDSNVIGGNGLNGLTLEGRDSWAAGNFIGLGGDGVTPLPNGAGIYVTGGNNRIGTNADGVNDVAERNVIGGNGGSGIWLNGTLAVDNVIQGNYIGTDASGTLARRHTFEGVAIVNGAQRNIVGTNSDGVRDSIEGNVISGSDRWGVGIYAGSHRNVVAGNRIGTNASGSLPIANLIGVLVASGSTFNRIGTNSDGVSDDLERNLVSGNTAFGVALRDSTTSNNSIAGNYIGLNLAGQVALANGSDGISAWSNNNFFGSNVIAGNGGSGLVLLNANDNQVESNTIGLAADGSTAIGHAGVGVYVVGARNRIGGLLYSRFNVISYAAYSGIEINGATSVNNVVQGNRIGTSRDGTAARGNGWSGFINSTGGVLVVDGATNNTIGTDGDGVNDAEEGNLISGNATDGVHVWNTNSNKVAGNYIGTALGGASGLANIGSGVRINRSSNNTIGGPLVASRNVISGNGLEGVLIAGAESTGNQLQGNLIGLNALGQFAIGNTRNGVLVNAGASNNRVGGLTTTPGTGLGNVISGNRERGIVFLAANTNEVIGNVVGLRANGTSAVGNVFQGIEIGGGTGNRIGGTQAGSRNVIGGNLGGFGEVLVTAGSGHVIQGNYIGTDISGLQAQNAPGGGVNLVGPVNALIGGGVAGAGNVIAGVRSHGIWLRSAVDFFGNNSVATGNRIQGNRIGVGSDGATAVPIVGSGVLVSTGATTNWIGTDGDGVNDSGEGNIIANSGASGVAVVDATTVRNSIRTNRIYGNGGLAIDLNSDGVTANDVLDGDVGPNQLTNYAVLRRIQPGSTTRIVGELAAIASTTYQLDFYANNQVDPSGYGEAQRWLGNLSITTDAGGNVGFDTILTAAMLVSETVSVTATDPLGNTSELSRSLGLDDVSPTSRVNSLISPATSLSIPISVTGTDPAGSLPASGVASYEIQVSEDGAPFTPWTSVSVGSPTALFIAQSGKTYGFRSVARDWAGNFEIKPLANEALIYVPDLTPPETAVRTVISTTATFQIEVGGTDAGGSSLRQFDLFVQIDGGTPTRFAQLAAEPASAPGESRAATTFQAIADGIQHTYRFYSVGIDGRNNVEAAPATGDVFVSANFNPPLSLAITQFDVSRGAKQRSFVRYVDVGFNSTNELAALVTSISDADTTNDRIVLTRFATDGSGAGAAVGLQGKISISAVDQLMQFDFGATGIGADSMATAGNGYYRLGLDLDGDNVLDSFRYFYRLLGDSNGDRFVNGTDLTAINRSLGRVGSNLDEDLNGSGTVTGDDVTCVRRGLGSSISAGLTLDD